MDLLSQIIHRRKIERMKMFYRIIANVVNVNDLKYQVAFNDLPNVRLRSALTFIPQLQQSV